MNIMQVTLLGLLLCAMTITTTGEKHGECPPERYFISIDNVRDFCSSDADCDGDQKCCTDNKYKICKPPAKKRAGSCPTTEISDTERCDDMCSEDSDCAIGAKCCMEGCGKICLPCIGVKKGFCEMEDMPVCIRAERSFCNNDTGCPGEEKCCPYTCALRCLPPLPERVGKCPAEVSENVIEENNENCATDHDCKEKYNKCCSTKNGMKCLDVRNV